MQDVKESIVSRPALIFTIVFIVAIIICRSWKYDSASRHDLQVNNRPFEENGYSEGDCVEVCGKVDSITRKDQVIVELSKVALITEKKNIQITGKGEKIQVFLEYDDIKMGQYIWVSGNLRYYSKPTNWGEFDSYSFYSNRGILCKIENGIILKRSLEYNVVKNKLWLLRQRLESIIDGIYEEDDAGLLKAMLLGIKNEIPKDVKEAFQKSGLSHLLAISGLHVSFLCMFVYKALTAMRLKRYLCIVISEILLWLYIVMVGMPASAMRAGIMFSLFIISGLLKRSYDMISAMAVSAVLLLANNPWQLFDSAFQLSFLAIVAIGVFEKGIINNSRYLNELLKMRDSSGLSGRLYNTIIIKSGYNLFASFSVFIVTLPVLLYCYYEVALYSVLLNLLIIPFMPSLLIFGIASILLTGTVEIFGRFFAYLSHCILELFKICCSFLETSGVGRRNLGEPSLVGIVIFYILISIIVLYKYKYSALVRLVCLLGCCFVICFHNNEGIYMLDVGQGECMVVIDKKERAILFDCGSSSRKNISEYVIIPFLKSKGVSEIKAIFLSHTDEDHINGMEYLITKANNECIQIDGIYLYKESVERNEYETIVSVAASNNIDIRKMDYGDRLCMDDFEAECIYPRSYSEGESNNNSMVLKVNVGNIVVLETGDMEIDGESSLVGTDIHADILKIGHHGSSTSTSEKFLASVNPSIALISAGRNNSYGHPHREVIELLDSFDLPYFCTKSSGAIRVRKKNKIWKLETFM